LRSIPRYQEWLDKVRPISLGVPAKTFDSYLQHSQSFPAQKSTDIFFSGRISDSSSVRRRGLDELLALRSEGVIVDIPDRVLPRGEFLQRCAHARMVWCPEGFGWDCFRMYEAALCGSVPLVSRQTIERHEPLVDGIHALYYDIESGGLRNQIQRALKDFPGLVRIAAAARAHVMSHHTPMAIARYVADTTLASLSLKRQSTE